MKKRHLTKQQRRGRRHIRIRARVSGTAHRPRFNVFRSHTGIFLQLIDDTQGVTLASVRSQDIPKEKNTGPEAGARKGETARAYHAGKMLAEKAKEKDISIVVFDRGGYQYHGRVKAAADGARDGGLVF